MRNSKSKIRVFVLIMLLLVAGTVMAWLMVTSQPISNPYFFEKGITEQEYEGYIYPLSSKEIRENVTLKITRLEEFRDGELYALELKQLDVTDTEDMISMGRQYLGYFYVKDSQIYRLPVKDYAGYTEEQTQSIIKAIREDEKSFLNMCHIACSEEVVEDAVDDQGYHSGIKADRNQRIYYFYNEDTSGTKDYEKIVWEKGKGIVYYQRGAGNMLMHIEFGVDLEDWLENQQEQDISTSEEMYPYEVEQKTCSFSIDQGQEYQIPYVRVSGLQDTELQWKINHTLWENACWIFDCAELTTHLYCLFDGSNAMQITGIYKYENYLSVVYEGAYEQSIEGHIAYAIVVDMLTGKRVLMSDMVAEPNELKELLLHYFDEDTRIMRLFITENIADNILFFGSLTETETVNNYISSNDGSVSSVSCLFDAASFYMTEEAFVVLPGAICYEPLYFEWEEMEGIVK